MKPLLVNSLIQKQKLNLFNVGYTPGHKIQTGQHVLADKSHPLHMMQRRRDAARKQEGLWWHATTGLDLSKSGCVRSWARRRLREAMKAELKYRGYDETGRLVDVRAVHLKPDLLAMLQQGKSLNLEGSLRLYIRQPLVPASYAQVRGEAGKLIECLLEALKQEGSGQRPKKKPFDRTLKNSKSKPFSKARPGFKLPLQQQKPSP